MSKSKRNRSYLDSNYESCKKMADHIQRRLCSLQTKQIIPVYLEQDYILNSSNPLYFELEGENVNYNY